MTDPIQSALSALTAFQKKTDVIANNVANSATDNFKKSRATFSEAASGSGVTVDITRDNSAGMPKEVFLEDETVTVESANVDLVEEITELIPTTAGYRANAAVIRTGQENIGTLLDIFD